jgi:hypothetical protein
MHFSRMLDVVRQLPTDDRKRGCRKVGDGSRYARHLLRIGHWNWAKAVEQERKEKEKGIQMANSSDRSFVPQDLQNSRRRRSRWRTKDSASDRADRLRQGFGGQALCRISIGGATVVAPTRWATPSCRAQLPVEPLPSYPAASRLAFDQLAISAARVVELLDQPNGARPQAQRHVTEIALPTLPIA